MVFLSQVKKGDIDMTIMIIATILAAAVFFTFLFFLHKILNKKFNGILSAKISVFKIFNFEIKIDKNE